MNERNHLSPVAPVYAEVGKVGRNDRVLRIEFTHPNQAQIGEVRITVEITGREFRNAGCVLSQAETECHQATSDEIEDQSGITQVKDRLCQHGFTGEERTLYSPCNLNRPFMVPVIAVAKSYKQPVREERSAGPAIFPASFMKGRTSAPRARSNCSRMILPCETPIVAAVASNHSARSSGSRTVIVLRICSECNTKDRSAPKCSQYPLTC